MLNEIKTERYIHISVNDQRLRLIVGNEVLFNVLISTATNGVGELNGSECTPRGWHKIRAKIGHNCPENTVFRGRRPTGEIYTTELEKQYPKRDWILTRIMWLSGLEPGFNRFGVCDTMQRYIYIHGSPDAKTMGMPGSHGCIRMKNNDVIELFNKIEPGIVVLIE